MKLSTILTLTTCLVLCACATSRIPMMEAVADWAPIPLGEVSLRTGVG